MDPGGPADAPRIPTILAFLVLLMPGIHLGAVIDAAGVVLHFLMPLAVVVIIYAVALQGLA